MIEILLIYRPSDNPMRPWSAQLPDHGATVEQAIQEDSRWQQPTIFSAIKSALLLDMVDQRPGRGEESEKHCGCHVRTSGIVIAILHTQYREHF